MLLDESGGTDAAEEHFQRVLAIDLGFVKAHYDYDLLLEDARRLNAAEG